MEMFIASLLYKYQKVKLKNNAVVHSLGLWDTPSMKGHDHLEGIGWVLRNFPIVSEKKRGRKICKTIILHDKT
jgi:hypothetical protein